MATPLSDADDGLISGIIEAAPDGIVMIDGSGTIVLVNRQTEELFGYDRADLLGESVEMLLPGAVPGRSTRRIALATRSNLAHDRWEQASSLLGRKRDGTEFPIEISLSPLVVGGDHGAIAMVRDITDRLESERLLHEAAEALQLLEDRERIARDLHDLVIQRLFAAGMALQATISRLDDQDVADRVSRVVDDLDDTIGQLRTVIFGLQDRRTAHPSIRSSVLEIVAEERAALGFEPRIRFDGPVDSIGDAIAEHVLAVLREALSNVARHAHATEVDIHLAADAHAPSPSGSPTTASASRASRARGQRPAQRRRPGGGARRDLQRHARARPAGPSSSGGCHHQLTHSPMRECPSARDLVPCPVPAAHRVEWADECGAPSRPVGGGVPRAARDIGDRQGRREREGTARDLPGALTRCSTITWCSGPPATPCSPRSSRTRSSRSKPTPSTDDESHGWSVLVVGRAELIDTGSELERFAAIPLLPWTTSTDDSFVRIATDTISGRAFAVAVTDDAREHAAVARSIARVLAPSSIAVVGASRREGSIGRGILANLRCRPLHRAPCTR